MYIVIPHFSQELASLSGYDGLISDLEWPKASKINDDEKTSKIVLQINGKKKNILIVPFNISEEDLIRTIKNQKESYDVNKLNIKKVIFVKIK